MVGNEIDIVEAVRALQGDAGQWGITSQADPVAESQRLVASEMAILLTPQVDLLPPLPQMLEEYPAWTDSQDEPLVKEPDWLASSPVSSEDRRDPHSELRSPLLLSRFHVEISSNDTNPSGLETKLADYTGTATYLDVEWEVVNDGAAETMRPKVTAHSATPNLSVPFTKDLWFLINDDMDPAESVDDTQDYRNRIISAQAYWKAGDLSTTESTAYKELGVFLYLYDGFRVAQDSVLIRSTAPAGGLRHRRYVGLLVPDLSAGEGVQTGLVKVVNSGGGDFYLKVDHDTGNLFVLHQNYVADWNVRVRLVCGEQYPTVRTILVPPIA